jgi:eukaryotic-like serine/threonine-protein kinase
LTDGSDTATVLVVDDDEANRDLLAERLGEVGLRVVAADSGRRALEVVETGAVDLVLLDITMPGLDGFDTLRALRGRRSAAELPVIMVTGRDEADDVVEALELGANDYVTKPLHYRVVAARIQAQLRTLEASRRAPRSAAPSPELKAGEVLAERYHLESPIGTGHFGTVWRARHLGLESPVAVKVLRTSVATPSALERFRREGMSACRVRHPNAVSVLDFGVTAAGVAYLVMELLEGHTLDVELKRTGRLSPVQCARILVPLCSGLAEAHRAGIIHRDIKPANIFLHGRPSPIVKILDFGIAKLVGEAMIEQRLTLDGWIVGTPAYMAPERLERMPYDERSDVYSLGTVLYEMLSGRLPFAWREGDPGQIIESKLSSPPVSLRRVLPDLPARVEAVVMQALRRDPSERPTPQDLARSFCQASGFVRPAAVEAWQPRTSAR